MPLSFMLYSFFWIATGKENGSTSDVLGDSLDICVAIIYSLHCSPRSPLTKALFPVKIDALIFCRNDHENMMFHDIPYPIEMDTVTGFLFTTKGVL